MMNSGAGFRVSEDLRKSGKTSDLNARRVYGKPRRTICLSGNIFI